MSVCTSPAAESFDDVAHRCQMSRDERWAVLNRNTFQDILNSILTQTPTTPLVFSGHSKVETNSFAKARLRKLCSNGSGSSSWSENDNFEEFNRCNSPKIVNNERNRMRNNIVSSNSQTIETIDSKKDTVERPISSTASTAHFMLHMGPNTHDYFDPLTVPPTNNIKSCSDSRCGAQSFSKHDSINSFSPGRLVNDPKLYASRLGNSGSEKSNSNDVNLVGMAKPSANRNIFCNENSYNSEDVTYFPRNKRKLDKIEIPDCNIQDKSELDRFTRDDARKCVAGNEKIFGRHRDLSSDLVYTDSINNTDCDRDRSSRNNCPSTHKQHSPRASIVNNSPTPTTTESFPFRIPLPFVHPKLKPLVFEPPFSDVAPQFQSPRDLNEIDVYRFAFNLCTTDSKLFNTDDKSGFQNSLNRLHEIGIRREFFDGTFERNFNRPDFDAFSKYTFGNQFEFFNMSNPLRLFQESMHIKSEFDLRAMSTDTSEGCLRKTISERPTTDLAAAKSFKQERSDYLNSFSSASFNKSLTTPCFTRSVSDDSCHVNSESDMIKCSRILQTSPSGANSEGLDRVQVSSFDSSHNNNNNNNRPYFKEKAQTKKSSHLENETDPAQNKTTRVANDIDMFGSHKVVSYGVGSENRDNIVNVRGKEIVSTNSSTSLSNIVPSESVVRKSKNHSVLAILGPLLSENTDRSISPAFSSEDTRALRHSSNNDTLKYNDESSDCFRSPNLFKRNLVTGIYGSSRVGRETTGVWLAVSKDVLYNLMDRLLNGERGQMKECASEERFGDGQTWRVGFSRSTGGDYPGISRRSGPIETWLRRSNKNKTNSFKSVRYQLHCQRPFNTDPGEINYTVRPVQNERKHLLKPASEEIVSVNRFSLRESCLSASSDFPLELTCPTKLTTVCVNSDVTGTPVLRSLLDDDDVFMTSPKRDYQNKNDTISPIQCKLKMDKFNFTSHSPITTSARTDISTGQSSRGESETGDLIGCSPPSCEEDHPGTYAVVARKRKLCELLTCTESDDATALSKVSEVGGKHKTYEGADDCVRLRSMKWKSSMLLRLREEINSDTTPGQTN